MATHSSTLALKIPWTEELGAGYYPWGHKELGMTERLHFHVCDPKDCRLPGSSVHGILQARIVEWAAISFSGVSSQPRDQTQVSYIASGFFTTEPGESP